MNTEHLLFKSVYIFCSLLLMDAVILVLMDKKYLNKLKQTKIFTEKIIEGKNIVDLRN